MHILIAPNAFKHSLNAKEVALAIQKGLENSKLAATTAIFPIGDGGNGTGDLIIEKLAGEIVPVSVKDPLGRPIRSSFGLIENGQTAVIEMANASGLHLLAKEELNPLLASSYGTGQLIRAALNHNVKTIIIGMGGSATVDGGSGMLQALGIRFLNEQGSPITLLPQGLSALTTLDFSAVDPRIASCEIKVLCDVDNPLLGKNGTAAVFGPQKGATPAMVIELDQLLTKYAQVLYQQTGIDIAEMRYGGVAGGASAGLLAALNAQLLPGIDYFLNLTHFDEALAKSDLVITGEGSIDIQTLQGKGPFGVAKKAKAFHLPVVGLAGSVPLENEEDLGHYFDLLMAIGNRPLSLEEALPITAQNLARTASQLGNFLSSLNG